ncbi:MAG: hypothetical protein FWD11_10595 [Micrococcales bacterium]|nr:hypothetical protein [Micrococcales bacterium]
MGRANLRTVNLRTRDPGRANLPTRRDLGRALPPVTRQVRPVRASPPTHQDLGRANLRPVTREQDLV